MAAWALLASRSGIVTVACVARPRVLSAVGSSGNRPVAWPPTTSVMAAGGGGGSEEGSVTNRGIPRKGQSEERLSLHHYEGCGGHPASPCPTFSCPREVPLATTRIVEPTPPPAATWQARRPGTGLLVVGHGTADLVGAGETREIARQLTALLEGVPVELGFLEVIGPSIDDACAALAARRLHGGGRGALALVHGRPCPTRCARGPARRGFRTPPGDHAVGGVRLPSADRGVVVPAARQAARRPPARLPLPRWPRW